MRLRPPELRLQFHVGDAVHAGTADLGEHGAMIAKPLCDEVHAILAGNARSRANQSRAQTPALLKHYISQAALKPGRDACPAGTRDRGRELGGGVG